jgi:hypothetical protein
LELKINEGSTNYSLGLLVSESRIQESYTVIFGSLVSEDDSKVEWVFSEPNIVKQYYD